MGTLSDDVLVWRHGAAWLKNSLYNVPAAFRSTGDLLFYWEVTAPGSSMPGSAYSLNGVPVQTAICVNAAGTGAFGFAYSFWFLYMAPSHAATAWYYLLNWLNCPPGLNNYPVVTGSKSCQYVAIANTPEKGSFLINCVPDTSKLTKL